MPFEKVHGRFYLVLGSFIAFTLAFFSSLYAGNDSITALRDGSIGCLVGFYLTKYLLRVVMINANQVMDQRRELYRQAMEEAAARADAEAENEAKAEAERIQRDAEAHAMRAESEERRKKAA